MTARWRPLGCLVGVAIILFVSMLVTVVVSLGIWPGEAKLTAPLLCPAEKADAFVVADSTSVRPGETSTSFTLYCVDENGAFAEIGWWRPMLLLWAAHTVPLLLLAVLVRSRWMRRRRRHAPTDAVPGPLSGPIASSPFSH